MLNTHLCKEMSSEYETKIQELSALLNQIVVDALPELTDVPFNLGSNEHLSAILFGGVIRYDGYVDGKREGTLKKGKVSIETKGFGFTPREGTEAAKQGYYSVDKAQLDGLKCKPKTPQYVLINSMSELSNMEKMKSTYCDSLLEKEVNSIVHPSINETTTRTGRYSASNPNTQNMPREGTSPVKCMFITRYKDK
jgi:DNA polymerase I-like protein with 3'-5' exonuclease and polymerase domains